MNEWIKKMVCVYIHYRIVLSYKMMRSFNVVNICQFGGIWYPSVLPVLINVFQRNRNRTGLIRCDHP